MTFKLIKNFIVAILVLVIYTIQFSFIMAQPGYDHHNKMGGMNSDKLQKIFKAHINEELQITDAQKDKFWKVYDEKIKKVKEFHSKNRKNHNLLRDEFDELKDDEIIKIISQELDIRQEILDIERSTNKELLQIITPKQLVRLKTIEHYLKKMMRGKKRMGRQHKGRVHPSNKRPPGINKE